ncbi:sensor histidine kinase [Puniceibacterium sediminis]|uniref:histidine kinase n=1 Tax=Puniceibacterium sediminis TaxID=1608407 RepID=A0A238W9T9_9RHOB|nr:PAS domain S-box protein [Puniceibacterium sediminis]SNR43300.1 PAS domain S-box-containing protein [Puniceibacterium sediminis]
MSFVEKYRLAFEISPVPMLLASMSGEILLANSGFHELFEYDDGELLNQTVDVLVPDAVRSQHPELRDAYYRVPTKRSMGAGRELNGVTKSGKIIALELGLEPVKNGDETWALVAAIDIRQRKSHEERMHLAMNAAASAMVMVNESGGIVFVNMAAEKLFGYANGDLLNRPVELLVPDEFHRSHPVYVGSYMTASETRRMGAGRDLFARHRNGAKIPVGITLTPVDSPDGKLVMSTIIDLSERVAAMEALADKSRELEALNVELSHFAYSASHDLKAPLSSIAGLLAICLEDLEENNHDEVRKNLKTILEISGRSAKKVEGILKIARAGHEKLPIERFSLEETIREIWIDLTGGTNSDTQLVLVMGHSDPVSTELGTLKLILENLISNALRYGDPAKPTHEIHVSSLFEAGFLSVTVADNGIGIPEKNKSEVMQMFRRINEKSGDGLGLALVRKQIDRMGGTLTFTSTEGEGAEFSFSLPLSEASRV